MEKSVFEMVPLAHLMPNKWNTRKNFKGKKFDELVESVRQKGILEPILVRPLKKSQYEIIAGERRYRALLKVSKSNGGDKTLMPAIVRELTDDEAFDIMMIENLQREDLNELEEAESFKAYADRKGVETIPELATRIGIGEAYIRRRIRVLELPEKILKAWGSGELLYGHLEQFMRLKVAEDILSLYKTMKEQKWNSWTVKDLRKLIDEESPSLSWAKFDKKKAGCLTCSCNSEVQKSLFGLETGKDTLCGNLKCFMKEQRAWFEQHWKDTKHYKKYKTKGFRFRQEAKESYEVFWSYKKVTAKCKECVHYLSLIDLNGDSRFGGYEPCCFGDKSCYSRTEKQKTAPTDKDKGKGEDREAAYPAEGPEWHAAHFREQFYQKRIPELMAERTAGEEVTMRLTLFSVIQSNRDIRQSFCKSRIKGKDDDFSYVEDEKIWDTVAGMNIEEVMAEIKTCATAIPLQRETSHTARCRIATHLGLDIAKEFAITQEYLEKKTTKYLLQVGAETGIFEDPKVKAYLQEILGKKKGRFDTCKKKELIDVFLKSGVDLVGRVPKEILNLDSEVRF